MWASLTGKLKHHLVCFYLILSHDIPFTSKNLDGLFYATIVVGWSPIQSMFVPTNIEKWFATIVVYRRWYSRISLLFVCGIARRMIHFVLPSPWLTLTLPSVRERLWYFMLSDRKWFIVTGWKIEYCTLSRDKIE